MSTHVLTNGFYFDLGLIVIATFGVVVYAAARATRRRRRRERFRAAYRKAEQHLVKPQRPSFPQGSHEGDWDWPRTLETDHRLRRP